jgi:hypothetical protein
MGAIKPIERTLADGWFKQGASDCSRGAAGNGRLTATPTAMRIARRKRIWKNR